MAMSRENIIRKTFLSHFANQGKVRKKVVSCQHIDFHAQKKKKEKKKVFVSYWPIDCSIGVAAWGRIRIPCLLYFSGLLLLAVRLLLQTLKDMVRAFATLSAASNKHESFHGGS
jgi:hypothetical protein